MEYLTNTPFTLQAVSTAVGRVWGNVPVLGWSSDVQTTLRVSVNCPLPCESCRTCELFTISASDFGTVSMRRRFCACMYKFLTTVTEGVVHGVYKVVIQLSFGAIRQHKVRLGYWFLSSDGNEGELRLLHGDHRL